MMLFGFIYLQRPDEPLWAVIIWWICLLSVGVVIAWTTLHLMIRWKHLSTKERRKLILLLVFSGFDIPIHHDASTG